MKRCVLLLIAFALLFGLACKRESSKVSNEMETARKIAKLEQDINGRQDEMNQLLQKYMQEGGKDVGALVGQTLTPEQKAVLEQKLKKEEGIGYRDLISDILKEGERGRGPQSAGAGPGEEAALSRSGQARGQAPGYRHELPHQG